MTKTMNMGLKNIYELWLPVIFYFLPFYTILLRWCRTWEWRTCLFSWHLSQPVTCAAVCISCIRHCVTACSYRASTCHFFQFKFSARLKHTSVSNASCWSTGEDFGCTVIYFSHADPEQACHQFDHCVCICFTWSTTTAWWAQIQTCPTHTHAHTVAPKLNGGR